MAIDCRKWNDNTFSDVTPFPDQDNICNDVARAKVRSKIDMSNAYEQILVHEDDTAFATIYGTFYSCVMQIGDCNAPATFQRLMTSVFQDCIGKFVHVYLDDIFVFSESVEDHEKHLKVVFELLRKNLFYLREDKVQLYANEVDCLGHKIDDKGIHADGIRWIGSEPGNNCAIIMMFNGSWDWSNTSLLIYLMLQHTQVHWVQ